MKAIRVHQNGGPEQLRYEDIPDPVAGPGQVVVKLEASGVNFIDTYQRSGLYKLPLPVTLGQEGAGVVESVAPDVKGFAPGDRVGAYALGCYAEKAALPAGSVIKLPDNIDFKAAAASILQGMTAHYLLFSVYKVGPGSTCLIHAAAGGVGLILVQWAKALGATVIGTTSSVEKAAKATSAGADHMILYTEQDFEAETRKIAPKGVDVVYDAVGATTFLKSLNTLRPRGTMCTFGNASGPAPAIEPLLLSQKGSLILTRPKLGDFLLTPDELAWRSNDVFSAVASGKLNLHIDKEYKLADAAQAHRDLESRKTSGKLILLPQ